MARSPQGNRNKRYYDKNNQIRKNERIRAREVRLIGPEGDQLGIVSREKALELAKYYGLDLLEVAATARPPVCRILDFGKYMYEQSKKKGKDKAGSKAGKLKEVKFRVCIDQHDYMTKLRHAEEFLYKGNKVKLSLMFRGREMEHKDLGFEVIERAVNDLKNVGHSEHPAKLAGRNIVQMLVPVPQNKRKLIYNESRVEEGEEE